MKRSASLVILTRLGVVLTAATYEARQPRPEIHGIQEVADNLYLLSNPPPPAAPVSYTHLTLPTKRVV